MDGPVTSDASFWRILFSPGGPGHVLFLQSELTGNQPRIYTDNIQMTRWLQGEIQGKIKRNLRGPVDSGDRGQLPEFGRPALVLD